jgi:hypothetical protein
MEPTQELIDDIYREKVRRARRMKPEAKLLAGIELFEYAAEITKAGIRSQFPLADEKEVLRILRERLALRERLEGRPWT